MPVLNSVILLDLISKITYMAIIIIFLVALTSLFSAKRKQDIALGKVKIKEANLKSKSKSIQKYKENLYTLLEQKDQVHMLNYFYTGSMIMIFGSGVYLFFVKQILLALLFPIFLLYFLNYVCHLSIRHITEDIEAQLPVAIDHIIRISSKSESLKTIFYEASKRIDDPLKTIFEQIALKMSTMDSEPILLRLGNEYNNIWIYSFTFILIGYTKQDNKAEAIENLRNLRDLLENENQQKKIQKTERKYAIAMNYIIAFLGIVGWVLNLILNPIANDFFFGSFMGLGCLLIGLASIFATVIINIRLSKQPKT